MEEKILAILREILDTDDVDRTCSQNTCELWDSMAQLNLVVELENAFGVSFEPEEIRKMTSYDSIVSYILQKTS